MRLKNFQHYYLVLFFLLTALPLSAAPLKEFEAVYKAKYFGISITATRKLENLRDGRQKFSFVAESWLADFSESSFFHWTDDGNVVPERYVYERSGLGRDKKAEIHFDTDNKTVTNNVDDKPWNMEIPDNVLDKLNFQIQLQADLIDDKPLPTYDIADGGHLKQWDFEILGKEKIKTPAGKFDTIKVKRIREPNAKRNTIFWLAPDWDYLVVRLEQEEGDDKSYTIDLHRATIEGKEVKGN